MTDPDGWPQKVGTAGLTDNVLFLVLAPAGTSGTALPHHSLAALMEDSSAFSTPDCGVKLKGKDDVLVVADLADEASLGAQVTVVDMLGCEFNQGFEEPFIYPLCNLLEVSNTESVWRLQEIIPVAQPFAQLLQSTTSAQAQVVPQKFQLLPAPANEVHAFHMLIQRGVHQLQVDERLGPDLGQELQGLPAYLRKSMKILPVQPRLPLLAGCCVS